MSEATSAYVFPFKPFAFLDVVEENSSFLPPRHITADNLQPALDILAPRLELPAGDDLAQRLLEFFADPAVCFGDPSWILQLGEHWKEQFNWFIARNEPILLSILGFPFKAPVPLKTNRKLADFGELVMLARLNRIGEAITRAYTPGAVTHVFAEGSFHEMNGMPREDADAYFAGLETMLTQFGYDAHVKLHDTSRIADEVPGFKKVWAEVEAEIAARRDAGDPATVDALTAASPVTFHLNANPGVSDEDLRLAYLGHSEAAALRGELDARTQQGVVRYRAFLEARDRVSLLEIYAPRAIGLTVSPRPGRIGVRPLPAPADVLPYHGVPVWNPRTEVLEVVYLWDLKRSGLTLEPLLLDSDPERLPFLYEVTAE